MIPDAKQAMCKSDGEGSILWDCEALMRCYWPFAIMCVILKYQCFKEADVVKPCLAIMVEDADNTIRHSSTHVLRHYLIDKPVPACSLLARAHNFVLPPKDNTGASSTCIGSK